MPDMSLSMSLEDRQDDLPRTLRRKSLRSSDDEGPLDAKLAAVAELRSPVIRKARLKAVSIVRS